MNFRLISNPIAQTSVSQRTSGVPDLSPPRVQKWENCDSFLRLSFEYILDVQIAGLGKLTKLLPH